MEKEASASSLCVWGEMSYLCNDYTVERFVSIEIMTQLKLEYSDLNWEVIFLSKWMVYSVWIKAPHICWYHFLFTSVIINHETASTQILKWNFYPPNLTSASKYVVNDRFFYRMYKNTEHKILKNIFCSFHIYLHLSIPCTHCLNKTKVSLVCLLSLLTEFNR